MLHGALHGGPAAARPRDAAEQRTAADLDTKTNYGRGGALLNQ
jgi:hypothetical protein